VIPTLWILAGLFVVLLASIIATARTAHEATDGGLGTGLLMLALHGLALVVLALWLADLLLFLCVHS
jgi:hypothetical protein